VNFNGYILQYFRYYFISFDKVTLIQNRFYLPILKDLTLELYFFKEHIFKYLNLICYIGICFQILKKDGNLEKQPES
jgi:hypothetical protein